MTKNLIILTEKENEKIKATLDFFKFHNKNLTKSQHLNIEELAEILQEKL